MCKSHEGQALFQQIDLHVVGRDDKNVAERQSSCRCCASLNAMDQQILDQPRDGLYFLQRRLGASFVLHVEERDARRL